MTAYYLVEQNALIAACHLAYLATICEGDYTYETTLAHRLITQYGATVAIDKTPLLPEQMIEVALRYIQAHHSNETIVH